MELKPKKLHILFSCLTDFLMHSMFVILLLELIHAKNFVTLIDERLQVIKSIINYSVHVMQHYFTVVRGYFSSLLGFLGKKCQKGKDMMLLRRRECC